MCDVCKHKHEKATKDDRVNWGEREWRRRRQRIFTGSCSDCSVDKLGCAQQLDGMCSCLCGCCYCGCLVSAVNSDFMQITWSVTFTFVRCVVRAAQRHVTATASIVCSKSLVWRISLDTRIKQRKRCVTYSPTLHRINVNRVGFLSDKSEIVQNLWVLDKQLLRSCFVRNVFLWRFGYTMEDEKGPSAKLWCKLWNHMQSSHFISVHSPYTYSL